MAIFRKVPTRRPLQRVSTSSGRNLTALRRIKETHQYEWRKQIDRIRWWIDQRDLVPQSDIWIYPIFPDGYQAVVIIIDRVWIFEDYRGKIIVSDIQHFQGFGISGAPLVGRLNVHGSNTNLLKGEHYDGRFLRKD